MNLTTPTYLSWKELQYAWGGPVLRAGFKHQPEDFRVEEELGFEPDGEGEHLFLHIEKTGLSTFEAQALLSRHFKLPVRDIAYAGMKDKQGITRQWFSLHVGLGKQNEVDAELQHPQLQILHAVRNSRKLRRGTHKGNRFCIVLRRPEGDRDQCMERLQLLAASGVPNYFGVQRFGRNEDNLPAALSWFRGESAPGRQERSMVLSAARSYLFNTLLSARVQAHTWNGWIDGDVMALDGSASTFASAKAAPAELQQRLRELDIHATGPLWGRGQPSTRDEALALESNLALQYPELAKGLEAQGLTQERRSLRLPVKNLQGSFSSAGGTADGTENLLLEFSLARGTYATAVLRELLTMEER